jgi:hypothetical protein
LFALTTAVDAVSVDIGKDGQTEATQVAGGPPLSIGRTGVKGQSRPHADDSGALRVPSRSRGGQLALDTALCGNHGSDEWCDRGKCTMATAAIDGMLNHLRRAFGDGATLHYPWSPDDTDDPWEDVMAMDHGEDTPAAGAGA